MTLKRQTLTKADEDVSWQLVIVLPWAHNFACRSPLGAEAVLVFKDNCSEQDYIIFSVYAFRRA